MKTPHPPTSYRTAIALGVFSAVTYLCLAYFVAVLTAPAFSGGSYNRLLLFSLVAVGIPVTLWFRYNFWGPLALMVLVVLFWHVLVPVFGSEGDGTPVFALALAMTPLYLLGYAVVAGLELWLR